MQSETKNSERISVELFGGPWDGLIHKETNPPPKELFFESKAASTDKNIVLHVYSYAGLHKEKYIPCYNFSHYHVVRKKH